MHDRWTPTNLLDGRLWAGWGPAADDGVDLDRSSRLVELVARLTGRQRAQVHQLLTHSRDRGRYLLLRRLSLTRHAVVYLAVDRKLARKVAVKIHRDVRQDARVQAITESQALAQLSRHPNIVQIHDVGEHVYPASGGEQSAWLYSVLELCDCDLFEWCVSPDENDGRAGGRRDWTEVVARIMQAARGLSYLHGAGYTHRDIKPTNILILGGVAKLADFGSVARPGPRADVAGTAGFIAPEVDIYGPGFAADVFSLAATLWACMFWELPYAVPSGIPRAIAAGVSMQRAIDRELTQPRAVPHGLPSSVRELLERALDPDPERRPSLQDFVLDLQVALDNVERKQQARRWGPLVAGGLIVTLGVGFSIGAVRYRGSGALGSISRVAFDAFAPLDPLARAELAASLGDGESVVAELNRMDSTVRELAVPELDEVIARTDRLAVRLESTSPDHAVVVQGIAKYYRRLRARARASRGAQPRSK
ncbi:MAG: serine/threonine-protein kinase [Enhygromyxa sp.]